MKFGGETMKVGIMSFAHMHAYSYADSLKHLPDVELTAVYDPMEERGRKVSDQYNCHYFKDMEQFLAKDMDAVIICSENAKHYEMVCAAAKAGKHILCEKPIAVSIEQAEEMIAVCNQYDVILQTAFPVRFSEPIQQLKRFVDSGGIGEILSFRTTNRGQNPGGWFIDPALSGGGAVFDHTVHMVDIMRWLSGQEVKEVVAEVDTFFHDGEIDDAGLLTLTFDGGIIASHDASWSRTPTYPIWGDVTIEVIGTKGTVAVDAFKEYVRVYNKDGERQVENAFFGNDMDFGLVEDFIKSIREKRPPSITGYDGLKAMEVGIAAYKSSKLGRIVKI
jgi:predicted dehydrogenase